MAAPTSGQVLCPVVVGRESEQAVIAEALAKARGGEGGLLILVGEPGIGKSRLARDAEERARAAGMGTIRGRAAPGGGPIPFRPFAEAIQAAIRTQGVPDDPALAAYRPALRGLIPAWSETPAAEPSALLLFEGIRLLLHAVTGREGLVVVLEDLHWADADTLSVIDYLADVLAEEAIAMIATLRDEPGPAADLVELLAARRTATRLSLRRLPPEDTAEMARRSLELEEIPTALREVLVDRSEGVPFVVEEMLTAYASSGSPDALPPTYRELVRARMGAVSHNGRRVLNVAATIGRRFDWQLLAAVTGLARERLFDELRAAVEAKLVVPAAGGAISQTFGFRHSLVRDAILAELLPPERAELALRAADAIEASHPGLPGEWCERVADLREIAGDRTAAARHLQEAATRALLRGALGSAETMLERARTLATGDRWHLVGIDRILAEVLSLAGKTKRLQEIGASAIGFVREKRDAMPLITLSLGDLHLRLARGFAAAGDDERSDEHLGLAATFASQVGEKALLTRVNAFDAQRKLAMGDLVSARGAAMTALDGARELGLGDVASDALITQGRVAFLEGDTSRARETFERALEEARDAPVSRLAARIDLAALEAAVTDSLEALRSARDEAERFGAVSGLARIDLAIGSTLVDRFELEAASEALRSSIDIARKYRLGVLIDASAVEAQRAALAGSPRGSEPSLPRAGRASLARAVISLLDEDRAAAARAIAGDSGHVERALACLLGSNDDLPRGGPALAQGLTAFVALKRAGGGAFAVADERLEPFPWWRHVARRSIAEAAIEDGWGDPAQWLREDLAFFDAAGHQRIASACRALMRRIGAPVPRKGRGDAAVPPPLRARGVTSREMDVLSLIAQGLGNRDIAERMFLSARTIETHVANLMRKLEVDSRAGLRAAAADAAPSA